MIIPKAICFVREERFGIISPFHGQWVPGELAVRLLAGHPQVSESEEVCVP